MAINNHRLAPVLSGPVVTNGQTEFVRLAGRLAVQRKIANLSRTTPLHLFFHPRVSNDKLSVVQNIVTDQRINELGDLSAKFLRLLIELLQRISEPMRDLYVFAPEFAHQLDVVVTGNAKSCTGLDHAHGQAEHVWNLRATIHKVTKKNDLATIRRPHGIPKRTLTLRLPLDGVPKLL